MRCIAMQINLVEFLSWKTPCKNYFVTINIGNLEMSFKMTLNFFNISHMPIQVEGYWRSLHDQLDVANGMIR